jgi:transposase
MISALSGSVPAGLRVLVATRPVDFRRGADGLAATVQSILQQDRFSGTVFVFRSKRSDRVKLLVCDGTGLVRKHSVSAAGWAISAAWWAVRGRQHAHRR